MNIHLIGNKLLSNLLTGTAVIKLHVEKWHFDSSSVSPNQHETCAKVQFQPGNPAGGRRSRSSHVSVVPSSTLMCLSRCQHDTAFGCGRWWEEGTTAACCPLEPRRRKMVKEKQKTMTSSSAAASPDPDRLFVCLFIHRKRTLIPDMLFVPAHSYRNNRCIFLLVSQWSRWSDEEMRTCPLLGNTSSSPSGRRRKPQTSAEWQFENTTTNNNNNSHNNNNNKMRQSDLTGM